MHFLDDVPLATFLSVAVLVVVVIGYLSNDLTLEETLLYFGVGTAGAGAIGHARNGAGRGMRK